MENNQLNTTKNLSDSITTMALLHSTQFIKMMSVLESKTGIYIKIIETLSKNTNQNTVSVLESIDVKLNNLITNTTTLIENGIQFSTYLNNK